jgi:hypothetical protein
MPRGLITRHVAAWPEISVGSDQYCRLNELRVSAYPYAETERPTTSLAVIGYVAMSPRLLMASAKVSMALGALMVTKVNDGVGIAAPSPYV